MPAEPWYDQYDLGDDVRLQVAADGMISLHNVPVPLFERLPGNGHVTESGTAWKQYGAVTFFREHVIQF